MDKVYVLITGEYSDWSIMGFTETEEEAQNICARKNAESSWSNEWYYEEVEKRRFKGTLVKMVYCFTVLFHDGGTRNWEMSDSFGMDYYASDDKRLDSIDKEVVITGDLWHSAQCNVILDENNQEKAKKIAQDRLYKKLAEVELEYEDTLPPIFLYIACFVWNEERNLWSLSDKSHMEKTNRLDERTEEKSIGKFELWTEEGKPAILVKTVLDVNDVAEAQRISKERFAAFLKNHKGSDIPWLAGKIEEG